MVDTAPIRPGEELPLVALAAWLDVPSVTVAQFPGGHSNLTYLLSVGPDEYVLRRAPLGPIPPKAHDMAREFRLLAAIHPHFPPAPQPIRLCEDPALLGSPFYLMERRRGIIIRSALPPAWAHQGPAISQSFLDCLVQLHSVPLADPALLALGKPAGFVERQVRGWSDRWYRARTSVLPAMDAVIAFLQNNLPPEAPPALVHNDFKLDNLMFRPDDPSRVEAVLDWEMTTLGDPLTDLGLALCYWDLPNSENAAHLAAGPVPCVTRGPGWLSRAELAAQWSARTGRGLAALPYHEILGIFKLAVIVQQIYARWCHGQTQDPRFANFDQCVASLVHAAHARL